MSPYTEAHFAAALLHCGPHVMDCKECAKGSQGCPNTTVYRHRVYSYFFELFPEMVRQSHIRASVPDVQGVSVADTPRHEWMRFWDEYQAWVKS
ncbi:hypothetical protein LCGC14_1809140 [marine sediment metagenome]|uniref:Uncharacterized protein n=1 Tax=marine sediment metagenome TaxID=412755 RepID=A0A0F9GM52_9ZZZZ